MEVEALLAGLSLEEKAELCMGADFWSTAAIPRLSIPALRTSDGPHGLRKQEGGRGNPGIDESRPATCFPPASLAASSFDRGLFRRMGEAIGEEALDQGVDLVLGPAVNIKRSPLCGRNFEYVSEDPCLAGEYAAAFIEGLQGKGVGASLKHFAVNNQERLRMLIDAVVDERSLREIYLAPFERAVREAGPWTVMASYNRVNGSYACESEALLKGVLRGEWGFGGLVLSDWGAVNDRVAALRAGCDLEMPSSGPERSAEICAAVREGRLEEGVLDEAVRRVLRLAERRAAASRPSPPPSPAIGLYEAHDALAREIADKSMVLLKNEGPLLPLKSEGRYAVLGAFAAEPRYQGGGSSHVRPARLSSFTESLERAGIPFAYSPGYGGERPEPRLLAEAASCAASAQAAILFVGLTDSLEYEGLDRHDLSLPPSHLALIEAAARANPRLAVVLCAGSAVETPWLGSCAALLYAGVAGQAGGDALRDIIFGAVNPSGRLAETFPLSLADLPCAASFPGGSGSVHYREGIYVGYRYFASAKLPVRFPFGFGLSYTSFERSGLRLAGGQGPAARPLAEGESLSLELELRNSGRVAGAEVVQLYLRNGSANSFNPSIALVDFARLELGPGEERSLSFSLPYSAFRRYDPRDGWVADSGPYELFAASSSEELGPGLTVWVEGRGRPIDRDGLEPYFSPAPGAFDGPAGAAAFARLLGREPPPLDAPEPPIGLNAPLSACRRSLAGRLLSLAARLAIARANRGPSGKVARKALVAGLDETPLRSLVVMNSGTDLRTGKGLAKMMEGRWISGLREALASLKGRGGR